MMKAAKNYLFPALLVLSIIFGGFYGMLFPNYVAYLKPIGTIFINLILVAVVPLVFFSIAAAVERMVTSKKVAAIFSSMMFSFILTSAIAALFMLLVVNIFPPAQGANITLSEPKNTAAINLGDQLVNMFTAGDFYQLFSHQHLLPLICFAILVGFASAKTAKDNQTFSLFLTAGSEVFSRLISYVMYVAPIGFFAYFAVLISELGPNLLSTYLRVTIIYYVAASIYFLIAFSLYAFLACKQKGVKLFWRHIHLPALTALATCSSAMSIPSNLQTCKKMGVKKVVYDAVIPLGAFLHKEGSTLGGVVKIAFLFGIFHLPFTGVSVLLTALLVSILVGTVMGAIPSGGMLGELVILSVYGFPPSALLIIAAISIIIDPLATMLNVTGDCACSMLVARLTEGRAWGKAPATLALETDQI